MNVRAFRLRATSAALATVIALGASVALAQGKSDSTDDDADLPIGRRVCLAIGCNEGTTQCGSVSWTEWVWIWTPWFSIPWRVTETASCYERHPY